MPSFSNTSSISLINLDPDTAGSDLKSYLTNQSVFKDYNFDGSALSILIQLLATNQFKYNFYLNMIFSEMFNDSAQLRASLMSNAKDLNYLPKNYTSASANINLTVDTGGELNVLIVPKGTTFSSRVGSKSFIFTTDSTVITSSPNGYFTVNNLEIYEGTYFTDSYLMDYTIDGQTFEITNKSVDLSSITVTVSEDSGSSVYEYQQQTTLLDVTSSTLAYFIQPGNQENYEIFFGDGILGRKPKDNALIQISYRVSQGALANGARLFFLSKDVTAGNNNVSYMVNNFVTVNVVAIGGTNPESLESIRFNAPRHFETQERAVGESDYETLLQQQFPEIIAIAAFGGETLNPPQYGTVVISVVLDGVDGLPDSRAQTYLGFLNAGRVVKGITPSFTTPTDLYVNINSTVKYNVSATTLLASDLQTTVVAALSNFNTNNLEDFKITLYKNMLEDTINESAQAIIANDTDLLVYLKPDLSLGQYTNYNFSFNMVLDQTKPLIPNTYSTNVVTTISSSSFVVGGSIVQFADDGQGNIRLITQSNTNYNVLSTVGTVNYQTGAISIPNLNITSYQQDALRVFAQPASSDITVSGNYIMSIEPFGLQNINLIPVLV